MTAPPLLLRICCTHSAGAAAGMAVELMGCTIAPSQNRIGRNVYCLLSGSYAMCYRVLEGPKSDFKVINCDDVAASTTPYDLLRNQIVKYMNDNPQAQLFVTGHSLGGALAAVFTAAFLFDKSLPEILKDRLGATYTFGQPRVGDYTFCCNFRTALLRLTPSALAEPLELLTGRYVRVCNTYDIVTHIPPTYGQLYQHTGALAYLKVK